MTCFGAALAQGFIDAGGQNATISLLSHAGSKNMNAIVSMTLFNQFWYWYPLVAIIGVTDKLSNPYFVL